MTRCFEIINLNKTSSAKLTCLFLRKFATQNLTLTWFTSLVTHSLWNTQEMYMHSYISPGRTKSKYVHRLWSF